jgi:lysophospholipase L1-like esterase
MSYPTKMKLRESPALSAVVLLSASVFSAFVIMLIVDRCAGFLLKTQDDLVFEPYSTIAYSTPEFKVTARINNLGFRGADLDPRKRKRYRIVTLGDSFTFGWGVDTEHAWPRVLEEELQRQSVDAEVLNLGQPGTYPAQYAQISMRANPLLRPDLVVVAVNQGDDLGQTMNERPTTGEEESGRSAWSALKADIKSAYPNLAALRRRAYAPKFEVTAAWKEQASDFLSQLSPDEEARLDKMDAEIRGRLVRGELNPGILSGSVRRPDEIDRTLDLENPQVQQGIQEVAKQLLRIKLSTENIGGKVVVVSLPNGFFVSELMQESLARMGYVVHHSYLTTTAMDDAVRLAASRAGLGCLEVTRSFRRESITRNLFYRFDGHYNADGQRFFAESIEPFVLSALKGEGSPGMHK